MIEAELEGTEEATALPGGPQGLSLFAGADRLARLPRDQRPERGLPWMAAGEREAGEDLWATVRWGGGREAGRRPAGAGGALGPQGSLRCLLAGFPPGAVACHPAALGTSCGPCWPHGPPGLQLRIRPTTRGHQGAQISPSPAVLRGQVTFIDPRWSVLPGNGGQVPSAPRGGPTAACVKPR